MLKENKIRYFDCKRFIGCSSGTAYDTGASLLEDIKNFGLKKISIFDYCIHLGHGSQKLYGNRTINVHIRENEFLKAYEK